MNRIIQITRRHLVYTSALIVGFMAFGPRAFAELQGPNNVPISDEFDSLQKLFDFLKTIVQWLLVFGLLIAVAMIIWGGIK